MVGTGCALDAVTRGLTTGLVEARDFASGTSSRSSKLVHGGLRYLEMLDFRLVHEALTERGLLLTRLAPHLVRPVAFLYPLTHLGWERGYVEAGLTLYDSLARTTGNDGGLPWHKHLSRRATLRIAPALKKSELTGAVQYYDAKVDDARHTMELARTAATYGAHVASRVAAIGFLRQGERVTGIRALDKMTGREFDVHARQVVNATGVWTDDTQAMVGERGQFHVRASKGIHLVVPRDRIHSRSGIILRTEKSVLFVIPWGRHWIIGTTDTQWDLDKAHPAATSADIEYLLEHVNKFLTTRLTQADVEGVYAGLRPLLAGESEQTSKLSREHVVAHPTPGAHRRRRREVHDLPDHGARRHRRGGAHARWLGARVDDAGHPAGRRRRVPRDVEPAGRAGRGVRAARRADREDAHAARHPHDRDPRPHRGGPLAR